MFIFVRRRTKNTNATCEKTAGLRSGNFSDLKIFQFHDMLNENRFLGIFLGHGKRPIYSILVIHNLVRNEEISANKTDSDSDSELFG